MSNIVVPQLGESVVEARVARWLKKEGDRVETGEPIVELETEKIDLEVGADHGGVLTSIKRKEGEDVKVGELLATVDESAAAGAPAPSAGTQSKPAAAAAAPPTAAAAPAPGGPGGAARDEGAAAAAAPQNASPAPGLEAPRATPTARSIARAHDVNLGAVQGSGSAGRVMKQDVQNAIGPAAPAGAAEGTPAKASGATTPAAPKPAAAARGARTEDRQRMSKRRATIARRLVEAQRTAAMLTTFNEVDMTELMALRERRKEDFKKRYGVGLGIASFFVKASVAALKQFPLLNAEIQGDEIVQKHYYDIGMAVGAEGGLVVPVLRDADQMSFVAVEQGIREYAKRAGDGTLTLDDLMGGTFTITNGGVFGSLMSTPILNPPQVGILGLHKIQDRPMAIGGQIVVRPMMYVALSYDHRIVDGREAVQFLVKIKEYIEDPGHLLLES
jgi:2-oxoglutarate dehydrogenase E2 component (dihydrolipoamide succinyltransferase)